MFGLERVESSRKCCRRFDGCVLGIFEDIYTSLFSTQSSYQSSSATTFSKYRPERLHGFLLSKVRRVTLHESLDSWFKNTVREHVSSSFWGNDVLRRQMGQWGLLSQKLHSMDCMAFALPNCEEEMGSGPFDGVGSAFCKFQYKRVNVPSCRLGMV
jgi:hypothetical protein